MGHSIGDGIIVVALAAAFLGYIYLKFLERQRRLEILHQERVAAMEKGIPLPELPIDPPSAQPGDPRCHFDARDHSQRLRRWLDDRAQLRARQLTSTGPCRFPWCSWASG